MTTLAGYTERLARMAALARDAQILRVGDKPEFAALTYADYPQLLELLEDLDDALALDQARSEDDGTRIPLADVLAEFGA